MDDERTIRSNGIERGKYSVARLNRLRCSGEFDNTTEFFSERKNEWVPISAFLEDFDPTEDRIKQMRSAGIITVQILGAGDDDCPFCKELTQNIYNINEVPTFPPEGCQCVPWCRCVILAAL